MFKIFKKAKVSEPVKEDKIISNKTLMTSTITSPVWFPSSGVSASSGSYGSGITIPPYYSSGTGSYSRGALRGSASGPGIPLSPAKSTDLFVVYDAGYKSIVSIKMDGSVIWAEDAIIDDAADKFSTMISLGIEKAAGITNKVRNDIRDVIFEEIIEIAKTSSTGITADEIQRLYEATKIMEKLKGPLNK